MTTMFLSFISTTEVEIHGQLTDKYDYSCRNGDILVTEGSFCGKMAISWKVRSILTDVSAEVFFLLQSRKS